MVCWGFGHTVVGQYFCSLACDPFSGGFVERDLSASSSIGMK
jgi:hypothetical protein